MAMFEGAAVSWTGGSGRGISSERAGWAGVFVEDRDDGWEAEDNDGAIDNDGGAIGPIVPIVAGAFAAGDEVTGGT
jgi:hypothetical protein